ncbi:MAG: hypothetical protein MJ113_03590 [Lachnospiraceae bacterium]|nr:hypothetical protein [Lachnospiraceae bacterium]
MSEEMTKREERKEEIKEAKKKQRKGKKLTRHEKKVIKKNAKREQRLMFCLLVVLILVMMYFTDMFGLFDFPGNGFGEGYTSFSEDKTSDGSEGNKDDITDNDINATEKDLETKVEDNQEVVKENVVDNLEVAETPAPTEKVENNDSKDEKKDELEVGKEAVEITIKVKSNDYVIDGVNYSLEEIEKLLKDETKNYVIKIDTTVGRPQACDTLIDLLKKYKKY